MAARARLIKALCIDDDYKWADFPDQDTLLKAIHYGYSNHDYEQVKDVVWYKMIGNATTQQQDETLIRVLVDLPPSSVDLWLTVTEPSLNPELQKLLEQIDNTAGWIRHKRQYHVFTQSIPDPELLPVFEALYESMRGSVKDDGFTKTAAFKIGIMDLPADVVEKINKAKIDTTLTLRGYMGGTINVNGKFWEFSMRDCADYDTDAYHKPWLSFRPK